MPELLAGTTHRIYADASERPAVIARLKRAGGLVLRVSGAPVFAVQSRSSIEAEAKQLAIVGTLMASGLLLLAFAAALIGWGIVLGRRPKWRRSIRGTGAGGSRSGWTMGSSGGSSSGGSGGSSSSGSFGGGSSGGGGASGGW